MSFGSHGVAFAFWACLATVALASPPAHAELPESSDDATFLAEHRIVVRVDSGVDPAPLLKELRAGLEALPENLRTSPGGELAFELHADSGPLGLGAPSDDNAPPMWSDGRHVFHLYRYVDPTSDERALWRTTKLSAEERRSLWLRRGVVHAVIQRWDDVLRWSRSPAWHAISGWTSDDPGAKPLNVYAWAYSRALGMKSASWDLVTFAEEALVPVESLRADAIAVDDSVRCQELTKWRVFFHALASVDHSEPRSRGACPAFDAWADPDTIDRLEIVLAEPSTAHPESVFGHLMLRAVRKGRIASASDRRDVLEAAAIANPADGMVAFVANGALGGYVSTFGRTTWQGVRQRYLQVDQRSLRVFELKVTPEQREQVLARVWELERRGYVPYFFFSQNCSSLLAYLLWGALDGAPVFPHAYPWAMPTATLDDLAKIGLLSDGATRVPSDLEAAQQARKAENDAIDAVIASLPKELADEWISWRAGDPHDPAELLALVEKSAAPGGTSTTAPLDSILTAELQLQRFRADVAEARLHAIDQRRIEPAAVPVQTAASVLEERQRSFRTEQTAPAATELNQAIDAEWQRIQSPRRPMTPEEQAEHELREREIRSFTTLAAGIAGIRARLHLRTAAVRSDTEAEASATPPAELRRTGEWRVIAAGAGVVRPRDGEAVVHPAVQLHLGGVSEWLGEDRIRGFGGRTELRLLELRALLEPEPGRFPFSEADLVLFGFRTTSRGVFGTALARAMNLTYRYRRDGPDPHALRTFGTLGVPIGGTSPRSYFLFGAGPALELRPAAGHLFAAGGRVELMARAAFGGHAQHALRFELAQYGWFVPGAGFEGDTEAVLRLEIPVGVGGGVLVAPFASGELSRHTSGNDARVIAGVGFEAL